MLLSTTTTNNISPTGDEDVVDHHPNNNCHDSNCQFNGNDKHQNYQLFSSDKIDHLLESEDDLQTSEESISTFNILSNTINNTDQLINNTATDEINYKKLYEQEVEKNKILQMQLSIINLQKQEEMEILKIIENEKDLNFIKFKLNQLKKLKLDEEFTNQTILNDYSKHELTKFENEIKKLAEKHPIMERITKLENEISFLKFSKKYSKLNNCSNCNEKQEYSAKIIQKAFRSFRIRNRMKLLFPKYDIISQRNSLISEIVQTEQTYVKSLTLVQRLYIDPLKNSDLTDTMRFNLTISQIQKIFNNLSTILSMHRIFLINLEQKLKEWPKVFIGESFINQSFFFLFYVEYINGYNESSNTLRELRVKNKEFNTFLNETKKHKECKGLSLESFLILPIQRLPRYKLLLKGVLKHTLPDHTDFQNLKSAYKRISAINNAINSKKKEHETYSIINRIFNDLKVFTVQQDYHFVKYKLIKSYDLFTESYESTLKTYFNREGFAQYTSSEMGRNKSMRVLCFLFEHLMIITSVEKKVFNPNPIYKYLNCITFNESKWIDSKQIHSHEQLSFNGKLDSSMEYVFIEQEGTIHALSFERESPIANTHSDWSKKLYKQLHLTIEDEQINNVKQFEMREILRICDQVFHKFSTSSSLNKLESTVFEEPSPRNSMMKTLSFLKKSPSLTAVKHTEDEEHEVKKLTDNIQLNTEHF